MGRPIILWGSRYDDLEAFARAYHLYKVKHRLPLEQYLVAAIGTAEVDPFHKVPLWTPRSFLEAANDYFTERFAQE